MKIRNVTEKSEMCLIGTMYHIFGGWTCEHHTQKWIKIKIKGYGQGF